MNVVYSDEVRNAPDIFPLVDKATDLLETAVGPQSSGLVNAEWKQRVDRKGRRTTQLTIRDFSGEASTEFTLDELENPLHMHFRIYRLWGDLLKIHYDQQRLRVDSMFIELISN